MKSTGFAGFVKNPKLTLTVVVVIALLAVSIVLFMLPTQNEEPLDAQGDSSPSGEESGGRGPDGLSGLETGSGDLKREQLGSGDAAEAETVQGYLMLDGAPLAGVSLEAYSNMPETIAGPILDILRATPFVHSTAGEDLRKVLDEFTNEAPTPDAAAVTARDGAFSIAVSPAARLGFRLVHDFYFLPPLQSGPYDWSAPEDSGSAILDFEGRLDAELGSYIQGLVTDADGTPLPRVTVELVQKNPITGGRSWFIPSTDPSQPTFERTVETDAEGRFRLRGVPPGRDLYLRAVTTNLAPARSELFASVPGQKITIDLELRPGATLLAHTIGPNGEPLADVDLLLERKVDGANLPNPGELGPYMRFIQYIVESEACTGPGGNALFTAVQPGSYRLRGSYPGLCMASTQEDLIVAEGEKRLSVELTLEPGEALAGRVVDESGVGLNGVSIEARQHFDRRNFNYGAILEALAAGEIHRKTTSSAPDGSFRVTGLTEEAVYDIRAESPGFLTTWSKEIKAGAQEVELVLEKPGQITGRVLSAATSRPVPSFTLFITPARDETRDSPNPWSSPRFDRRSSRGRQPAGSDGSGAQGGAQAVRNSLALGMAQSFRDVLGNSKEQTEREEVISDREGRFSLSDIVPGTYRIVITAESFAPGVSSPFTVEKAATARDLVVALNPGGSIAGRVVDPFGPVEKARVAFGLPADSEKFSPELELALEAIESVQTKRTGDFRLDGLPVGLFVLYVTHGEHPGGQSEPIDLAEGQVRREVVIHLPAGASIQGAALDVSGRPVRGRTVFCRTGQGWSRSKMARTDREGRFMFKGLAAGTYTVRLVTEGSSFFTSPGESPENIEVTVSEGELKEVLLREAALSGARLSGVVTDGGIRLDNGFMTLASEKDGETRSALINSDGSYSVAGVAPGSHRLTIRTTVDDQSESATMRVQIPDQQDVQLDLQLPGGEINGVVVDSSSGIPLPGARVVLQPETGRTPPGFARWTGTQTTGCDEEGRFRLRKLGAGTYRIDVTPPRDLLGPLGTGYCSAEIGGLVVAEERTINDVEIRLAVGGGLQVVVVDENQQAITGALITAREESTLGTPVSGSEADGGGFVGPFFGSNRSSRRTDREGQALLTGVAQGLFTVTVQANEYGQRVESGVSIEEGKISNLSFSLEKGYEVAVRLSDGENQPIERTTLTLTDSLGRRLTLFGGDRERQVNRDGTFPLGHLAGGTYTLTARWSDQEASAHFSVRGDETVELVLTP